MKGSNFSITELSIQLLLYGTLLKDSIRCEVKIG